MLRELLFPETRELKTRTKVLKKYTVTCTSGQTYEFTAHGYRNNGITRTFYAYDIESATIERLGYINLDREKVCELGEIEEIATETVRVDEWRSRNIDYGRDQEITYEVEQ